MTETAADRFYPLVDARCTHFRCGEPDAYRMVGRCRNCGNGPLLVLVSARHSKPTEALCPACGCYKVACDRLAEPDELPEERPEGSRP